MTKIQDVLKDSDKSQPLKEIKKYLERMNNYIDSNIANILYFKKKAFDYMEDFGEFFDVDSIIKEFKLSFPLNDIDITNKIKRNKKFSTDISLHEKAFYIFQVYLFFYYDDLTCSYEKMKEIIKKLNSKNVFLLNEAKNSLINETKNRVASNNFEENLFEDVWNKLSKEKNLIDNENINEKIKNYIKNNNSALFIQDLSKLCEGKIKEIDLNNDDPQNIYLKTFMEQNNIYYEMN